MKITANSPDLLIIEDIPWFMAVMLGLFTLLSAAIGLLVMSQTLLGGLVFLIVGGGMGLAAIGVFVERLHLILDARAHNVILRSRTIFRHRETEFPLGDLLGATGESTLSGRNTDDPDCPQRRLHRPSLVLVDGSADGGQVLYPITEIYDSGRGAATMVRAINDWLAALRALGPARNG
ncbi:MAG: hypothetical protein COW54_16120 [Rhodobacteraceae bacterium CG17_big_fil_post_rev_8_21_14_2_50_63_15]|nr:hypothetical protein [Roseovarius sp.]PIV77160.1 MAG: hypothetical protein COW54_16120 [Rhodobacteraceae bacterium CG17_big_fil_post_rev_8_21_14_2_50_63_15]